MQVLTLDTHDFNAHAERLARMVAGDEASEFLDAIVAVRRGGSFVCDAFCQHFPKNRYGERFDVTLQRRSTKRKNGTVSKILKRLPLQLLDLMRIAESRILSLRRKPSGTSDNMTIDLPAELKTILTDKTEPAILIIDDAIDSGNTLYAISATLKRLNPDVRIRTAVMTVTTRNPLISADFTLYNNNTLIRFPWSSDYRK